MRRFHYDNMASRGGVNQFVSHKLSDTLMFVIPFNAQNKDYSERLRHLPKVTQQVKGKSIIVFCPYKVFSKATDKGAAGEEGKWVKPNGCTEA